VNTPLDVAPRPSSPLADDEVSLSGLLELFEPSEQPALPPVDLRASVHQLWAWLRDSSRRAARWGAAGLSDRSARGGAEVAQ
jgi:hypothetical protein